MHVYVYSYMRQGSQDHLGDMGASVRGSGLEMSGEGKLVIVTLTFCWPISPST